MVMTANPEISTSETMASHGSDPSRKGGSMLRKFAPLAVIVAGAAAAYGLLGDYLSFEALSEHRQALIDWRDQNFALSAIVFMAIYAAVVAFSLPGAVWITLAGGFLFGLLGGVAMIVPAATLGATAIFLAAKTSLGDALRAKAGPMLKRLEDGFKEDAVSYLLMLRLVPAFPFFLVNLAPAFLGVRLWTYVWTTFVGIIPGTVVYTWVGVGLGEVFARGETPDLSIIFQPEILGPILGMAALAALPIVVKRLRRKAD
jgi:uncharacterized membrane protein YdjX (TVP38/TMEM64 family)